MDSSRVFYCFGLTVFLALLLELLQLPTTTADYPGVIELVGYSNRRARTHYIPAMYGSRQFDASAAPVPPTAKIQADIETVKSNIEKYNRLLTLDTRNLPESQKDMLERIVERVARLKETLDIEEHLTAQRANNSNSSNNSDSERDTNTDSYSYSDGVRTTNSFGKETNNNEVPEITWTTPLTSIETQTDPTLLLDATTLLHLQTAMDERKAQTTRMREMIPTTTESSENAKEEEYGTDAASDGDGDGEGEGEGFGSTTIDPQTDATNPADDQIVAARANNNNIAAITAADDTTSAFSTSAATSQQRTLTTSGKFAKTRATKRPVASTGAGAGSLTKTASTHPKRVQRPNQAGQPITAGLYKQTTAKQKLAAAATTTQPLQHTKPKQQHKPPQPQQQQQHYQKKPSLTDKAAPSTPSTFGIEQRTSPSTVAGYGSSSSTNSYNDIVYDEHVNTSAIIDSLSNVREELYQQKHTVNNNDKKQSSATAKPTKYHYYPHNQHIYLLPECAIQQVCNAVYVRLNYTQPLCACPSRYRDPCSASLNEDDQHTTKLVGDGKKKAITLAKTCEATTEMRDCRSPKDWSLLALQNTRTGKSHYLVICRCPDHYKMEGPMAHDQPSYAAVPGIRVFGMMCVKSGHSVRKPQIQPPKRYYLQKPFHRPNTQTGYINNNQFVGSTSSQTGFSKDNYGRPSSSSAFSGSSNNNYHSTQDGQQQQQPSYQYLNRPESIHSSLSSSSSSSSSSLSSNSYRPETISSINNFPGAGSIYGRNNERQGESPIEAQPPQSPATIANAADEDGKILISTSTQPTEESPTTLNSGASTGAVAMANSAANTDQLTNNKSEEQSTLSSAATDDSASSNSEEQESKMRDKRSIVVENSIEGFDDDMPEFPWDRVIEFQKTIQWD